MPYRLKITEDEVRAELAQMGFTDVSDEIIESFRKDLLKMIKSDLRKLKRDRERLRQEEDDGDHDATPANERPYSHSQVKRAIPETSTPLSPEQKLPASHRVAIATSHRDQGGYESGYSDRSGSTSNTSEVSYEGRNITSDISERNRQPKASKGYFPRASQSQDANRPSTTGKTVDYNEAKAAKTKIDTVGDIAAKTTSVRPKASASSSGWRKKDGQADIKNAKASKPKKTLPSYPSRNDPVSLYHFYRAHWDKYKPPGEDPRSKLRWEVRTKLFYS